MNITSGLDRAVTFLNCQLRPADSTHGEAPGFIRCVTVSRQAGCGASYFAEELAVCLQAHLPHDPRPWSVFDRNLVDAILKDQHLPARLASYLPEDRVHQLNDIIEDLCSLHPPTETMVRRASETILHLAQLGHAIIVGRGANIITARLAGVAHVRLVGSVEKRVAHMRRFDHLTAKEALQRIKREDGGRRRYIKRYFDKDIDDPLLYHLVINTDLVSVEDAAEIVQTFAVNHAAPLPDTLRNGR